MECNFIIQIFDIVTKDDPGRNFKDILVSNR